MVVESSHVSYDKIWAERFPGIHTVVEVYDLAFSKKSRLCLLNIFYHELAHVQGAKHLFASQDKEGKHNPSVMIGAADNDFAPSRHLELGKCVTQRSDLKALKKLYELKSNEYKGILIRRHKAGR